jgi:hypothetical protein
VGPDRFSKAQAARELARKALGRPADSYDDFDGLPPRHKPIEAPSGPRWEPIGQHGEPCLTLGEAAKALGISARQLGAMVAAGELATVPVGDFGGRLVPLAEVERINAQREG